MNTAAAEIVEEQRRASHLIRQAATIWLLHPKASTQLLSRWGLTRDGFAARTRLLQRARRGDAQARRILRERYACTVWQRSDLDTANGRTARGG